MNLNTQLVLYNLVPSEGKFINNNKFNAPVFGGVDGREVVDIYRVNNS